MAKANDLDWDEFNEIKIALKTPVMIVPSIRQVADRVERSSSTVSMVDRSESFADYKALCEKYDLQRRLNKFKSLKWS